MNTLNKIRKRHISRSEVSKLSLHLVYDIKDNLKVQSIYLI